MAIALTVVAHVAAAEVHAPRVAAAVRAGRGRPIARGNVLKWNMFNRNIVYQSVIYQCY